jgi:predicted nucleic acid-binding protein
VLGADKDFGPASREALRDCLRDGKVIACDVVWAETAAWFPTERQAHATLDGLGIAFEPLDEAAANAAGAAWRDYRQSGGDRARVIADFLVAGHAQLQADRLLTRDRGFYRSRFSELRVLDPAAGD